MNRRRPKNEENDEVSAQNTSAAKEPEEEIIEHPMYECITTMR